MAQSLSEECTPLKLEYDSCFNAWFEAYSKQKAEEFNVKCGDIWEKYKACVQKAINNKGLDVLLQQARNEHPLIDPPSPPTPPNSQTGAKKP